MLVTAGGTTEQIDSVRGISNISTGRLGSLIADSFAVLPDITGVYYVCNKAAVLPNSPKTKVFYVDNVASLENMIIDIVSQTNIDIIIHSMAVSDYRIRLVTSVSNLAGAFAAHEKAIEKMNEQTAESVITSLLNESKPVIEGGGKISSGVDNMLLLMERTPKVISMYQKISPQAILVGFKLLDAAPHEILIDTAFCLLQANKCDFVLANNLQDVDPEHHIGYLVDSNKSCKKFITKKEIADGIVVSVMEKRRNS